MLLRLRKAGVEEVVELADVAEDAAQLAVNIGDALLIMRGTPRTERWGMR